jgi:hypothetical protein
MSPFICSSLQICWSRLIYRTARRISSINPLAEPAATLPSTRAGRSTPRSTESERRSPLKSILMVAGALACFGAGASLPQFQSFMRGDLAPEPTVGQPSAPVADAVAKPKSEVAAKSDDAKPTSGEAKSADASSATSTSNEPKADTALNATGAAPPAANSADRSGSAGDRAAQSTPVPSAPVANDAVASQRPCPKGDANCLEGGAASPAKDLTNADGTAARLTGPAEPARQAGRVAQPDRQAGQAGSAQPARQTARAAQPDRQGAAPAQPIRQAAIPQDSERVEARASNGQEASHSQEASSGQDVRTQTSRRTSATAQRERIDQRSVARRDVATVGRSSRTQDVPRASESRWGFASDDGPWTSADRWQNSDERRERDGWRERVVDDAAPSARFSGRKEKLDRGANWRQDRISEDRWEERNVNRTSNARRDRSEESSREDRRGRSGRDDDFAMGRAERNDGPLMIFAPRRFQW